MSITDDIEGTLEQVGSLNLFTIYWYCVALFGLLYFFWNFFLQYCCKGCKRLLFIKNAIEATEGVDFTVSDDFYKCIAFHTLRDELYQCQDTYDKVTRMSNEGKFI